MGLYFAYKVQYNNLIYSSGKLEVQYWAYTQSINGYSSVPWWKIANYHVYTVNSVLTHSSGNPYSVITHSFWPSMDSVGSENP